MTEKSMNTMLPGSPADADSWIVRCPACDFKGDADEIEEAECPQCMDADVWIHLEKGTNGGKRAVLPGDIYPNRIDGVHVAILVPTVAIAISETLLYFDNLWYALWGHFVTLLICVFAPLYFEETRMFQVFALVPLFRLVNLGMPVFVDLTIYRFPLIYAPLIPGVYVVARNQNLNVPKVNSWREVLLFPFASVFGALLAQIEFLIITPNALIPEWSPLNYLLIVVVMFGFVGFVEEWLFRGVLQRTLEDSIGRWGGLLLASAIFGLMHSAYGSVAEIAFAFALGLLFGLIYDRTDSLFLITVVHGSLNVFLFAVIPIHGLLLDPAILGQTLVSVP